MNELLNIKVRKIETGELFFLTGFQSAGDSKRSFVTAIGLKSCEGKQGSFRGMSFGVSSAHFNNYELFSSIGDF